MEEMNIIDSVENVALADLIASTIINPELRSVAKSFYADGYDTADILAVYKNGETSLVLIPNASQETASVELELSPEAVATILQAINDEYGDDDSSSSSESSYTGATDLDYSEYEDESSSSSSSEDESSSSSEMGSYLSKFLGFGRKKDTPNESWLYSEDSEEDSDGESHEPDEDEKYWLAQKSTRRMEDESSDEDDSTSSEENAPYRSFRKDGDAGSAVATAASAPSAMGDVVAQSVEDGPRVSGVHPYDSTQWGRARGNVPRKRRRPYIDEIEDEGVEEVVAAKSAFPIQKSDDEHRFTLGPWYVPWREDAHGEWTDPAELQEALWGYVRSGDRRIRLQHNVDVVAGEWLEAMTWPHDVEVPMLNPETNEQRPVQFPAGTIFLGVQWEPWAWELVKQGKLRGYSIGGTGSGIEADIPEAIDEYRNFLP